MGETERKREREEGKSPKTVILGARKIDNVSLSRKLKVKLLKEDFGWELCKKKTILAEKEWILYPMAARTKISNRNMKSTRRIDKSVKKLFLPKSSREEVLFQLRIIANRMK